MTYQVRRATNEERQKALAARQFGTFKRWKKENRKWASTFRSRGDQKGLELARRLDNDFEYYRLNEA